MLMEYDVEIHQNDDHSQQSNGKWIVFFVCVLVIKFCNFKMWKWDTHIPWIDPIQQVLKFQMVGQS